LYRALFYLFFFVFMPVLNIYIILYKKIILLKLNSQEVRKGIARVNTVISQAQREQQKTLFKGKKYLPLDLRAKKTRAIRRRLTAFEASKKTVRQAKHDTHFAQRKFAVKA